MKKITIEDLKKGDEYDWEAFYLDNGPQMLELAKWCLEQKDEDSIKMGLKIVAEAYMFEDAGNAEKPPALSKLDFSEFVEPLKNFLPKKEFTTLAMRGLWVCCLEGVKIKLTQKDIEPYFDKTKGSAKYKNMTVSTMAFRVLVHILGQNKKTEEVIPLLKGRADFKTALFDELTRFASYNYDFSPLVGLAFKNLQAKGESPARDAVVVLWNLLKNGTDVSIAIPFLVENQKRLAIFADSSQLIAGFYLKNKKYKEMEAWLTDSDPQTALRAYRGLMMASLNGIDANAFLDQPGMLKSATSIANKNDLPKPRKFEY